MHQLILLIIQQIATTVRGGIESSTLNDVAMEIAVKEYFKEEFKILW